MRSIWGSNCPTVRSEAKWLSKRWFMPLATTLALRSFGRDGSPSASHIARVASSFDRAERRHTAAVGWSGHLQVAPRPGLRRQRPDRSGHCTMRPELRTARLLGAIGHAIRPRMPPAAVG